MTHLRLVLQIPERSVNRALRKRGKAHRRHEMGTAFGQNGRDGMAVLAQQADKFRRFVGSDASTDDEKNPAHVAGYGARLTAWTRSSVTFGRKARPTKASGAAKSAQ